MCIAQETHYVTNSRMKIASAVILLLFIEASRVLRTSAKDLIPGRLVPLYGDLDVSETPNLLNSVLQGIDACGHRFVWRNRQELRNATAHTGPLVLVATGGPNAEEHAYFHTVPDTQQIVLLHLSDEFLVQTDPSQYGPGVQQVFRHYYHKAMGEKAFAYLGETKAKHLPPLAWMPLGPARLRPLPTAYSLGLLDRTYLWSWTGSTDNKPEREAMLAALDAHSRAADIKARGVFRRFSGFAGVPGGSQGAMGAWEYTLLMHQTQFAPVPAGGSPEQFRIWEAFEAGDGQLCHASTAPIAVAVAASKSEYCMAWTCLYVARACTWRPLRLS